MPVRRDRLSAAEQAKTMSGRPMLASWSVPFNTTIETTSLTPFRFDQQVGGGAGAGGAAVGSTTFGVSGLQVVPAITISGRYDSNVFFTPALQGVRREDYSTVVTPQVFVRGDGRYVSTRMSVGATGEYFTVHPGLSYVGFNGAFGLSFDNLVRRWVAGSSLYITNFTNYTPAPPAFLAGGSSTYSPLDQQGGAPPLSVEDTYIRGFQLQRVNTLTNLSTIGGSYPVSYSTNLVASYTHAFINFGRQFQSNSSPANSRQGLFDNVQHTGRLGVSHQLTAQDTVLVQYTYNRNIFSSSAGGGFETHGGTVAWKRSYNQSLRSSVIGGASLINQEFSGVSQSSWVYTATTSLDWIQGLNAYSLSYSGGVYPSYVSSAGPIFSHLVAVTGAHRFTDKFVGGLAAMYSHNSSIENSGGTAALKFESKSANAWLNYRVTESTFLWLSYNYGIFSGNYTNPNQTQTFSRNEVLLSLSQYWR